MKSHRRQLHGTPAQNAIWELMFDKLAAFKRRHGHCRVPVHYRRNRRFGNWVSNQRQMALRGKLPAERRRRLLALGVFFKPMHMQWEKMLAGFAVFKRRHGHALVPRYWNEPRGLGDWVARQRFLYHRGRLPASRLGRLSQSGFEFATTDPRWHAQYARLAAFHKKRGHCNVRSGDAFGQWVYKQRRFRRQGRLDAGKIKLLDAIGFEWVKPGPVGIVNAARWEHRMKELMTFKRKHGHCRVPQQRSHRRGLGVWVANVRADHRRGDLPPDRVRELEKIGFEWRVKK